MGRAAHVQPPTAPVPGEAASEKEPNQEGGPAAPPLAPDLLLRIYGVMATARACDERMWILQRQGRARFVVTGRGHEAAQAGSGMALRAGHDYVLTYYRSMALVIGLGVPVEDILRNCLGREGDPFSGGRQMPNHFSSPALRIPTQSSVVAAGLTHAVGCAYAARVRGEDAVAVCYFGEGATAKGDFHEALNFAAIHHLPVVFFCENNGWAISVPYALEAPGPVASRAEAYAIPGLHVDGLDPVACYRVMETAVARARAGGGPTLIEARCVRLVPHTSDDDDLYRSKEERAQLGGLDPLPAFRARLVAWGVASPAELEARDAELRAGVRAAEARALAAAPAADAFSHLYAPASAADACGQGED